MSTSGYSPSTFGYDPNRRTRVTPPGQRPPMSYSRYGPPPQAQSGPPQAQKTNHWLQLYQQQPSDETFDLPDFTKPPPGEDAFYNAMLNRQQSNIESQAAANRLAGQQSLEARGLGQSGALERSDALANAQAALALEQAQGDVYGQQFQARQQRQMAQQDLLRNRYMSDLQFRQQAALLKLQKKLQGGGGFWGKALGVLGGIAGTALGGPLGGALGSKLGSSLGGGVGGGYDEEDDRSYYRGGP